MPTISTAKMTAKQFLALGDDPPGVRLELVNGEVAVSPSPNPDHQYTVLALARILADHIEENDLGELLPDVDTVFGLHDVRRPDLFYFKADRTHLIGETAVEGAPDLCIEVVSPSSIAIDRADKYEQYESAGVANYWIVDPARRSIEAFGLRRGKYATTGGGRGTETVSLAPFPELSIPLSKLWRKPRPKAGRRGRS